MKKDEARQRDELLRIDICDPSNDKVRQEVVKEGKQTAEWLLNYRPFYIWHIESTSCNIRTK